MFEFFKKLFSKKKHIHTHGYVADAEARKIFRAVFDTVTFDAL